MSKTKPVKLESKEKYQRLLSRDSGTCGIKAGHVILAPNENIGIHSTGEREELVIVLKGIGEARIGDNETVNIKEKEVLYIPPRTEHDIKNTGPGSLDYIFVTADAREFNFD